MLHAVSLNTDGKKGEIAAVFVIYIVPALSGFLSELPHLPHKHDSVVGTFRYSGCRADKQKNGHLPSCYYVVKREQPVLKGL